MNVVFIKHKYIQLYRKELTIKEIQFIVSLIDCKKQKNVGV